MKKPDKILDEIRRWWDRKHLLEPPTDTPFPRRISIPAPDSATIRNNFASVMDWYRSLDEHERSVNRPGYRIEWREAEFRGFGRNRAPVAAIIDTVEDALALIGKSCEATRYHLLLASTAVICPELLPWMRANALIVVAEQAVWEQIALVVRWFQEHPKSGIYRRQIDLPGIDTKFIEGRKALLVRLLDAVLPPEAIEHSHPPREFDQRYGLRPKPVRIGVRSLDPSAIHFGGLPEVVAAVSDLAHLAPPVRIVFIVENEITGLSFPIVSGALLIHGLGYGVDVVAGIPWVRDRPVWYWGDIDTHGFSILSRLRGSLPHVQSFLMDERTLLQHRSQCVDETQQDLAEHRFLTPVEQGMLRNLRLGTYGSRLRLEQERISLGWATTAITALLPR